MRYEVEFRRSALRDFDQLSPDVAEESLRRSKRCAMISAAMSSGSSGGDLRIDRASATIECFSKSA